MSDQARPEVEAGAAAGEREARALRAVLDMWRVSADAAIYWYLMYLCTVHEYSSASNASPPQQIDQH